MLTGSIKLRAFGSLRNMCTQSNKLLVAAVSTPVSLLSPRVLLVGYAAAWLFAQLPFWCGVCSWEVFCHKARPVCVHNFKLQG